ncbi:MAG: hypothetical protein PWP76_657 [Candidatus Diapherotrites archaeon]|nr:hypothetical protein [Candidatus Diapherotrites archaeon]MDN5367016.1 hypothetical protein [Candidatus Diapherotrites archaeon]
MDWWFVVIYVAFVLVALGIVASTPDIASFTDFGCALSADAASIHLYSNVHGDGCPYAGDHVGEVPLVGKAAVTPLGVVYEAVGK